MWLWYCLIGRPLELTEESALARAIVETWLPGTEGGHGVLDVLTGAYNPSGKLSMSFPYTVGQVPICYNHFTAAEDQDLRREPKHLPAVTWMCQTSLCTALAMA